jgi:hypothetical protein
MSYRDFTIEKAKIKFNLTIVETEVLFPSPPEVKPSNLLVESLNEFIPLATAINTEKARSEFLIAPVLAEVRRQLKGKIALFSGVDFNVDAAAGLSGFCDFLLSASSEQLYVDAPVVAVVEAKNENIKAGLGQCIAEMVASQMFNQQKYGDIATVWGVVTTGEAWRFLKLNATNVSVDSKSYYISNVGQILGIFVEIFAAIFNP